MNFRSNLALFSTGVEFRTRTQREGLLVDRLEHAPLAYKPSRLPTRPVLIGTRNYLKALRAAEMKAWEAGAAFDAE
jgi:hypothetical protein